jgi:hypothetical protein
MRILPFILLAALAAESQAQEIETSAVRLEDLRLDAPPATFLVGVSPSSVQRPNTPRALIASLVSATGSSGLVPSGFAMETSPYWLASHPTLTLEKYFHPSLGDRIRYFTAFSVATANAKAASDSVNPDAHVSIAVRTLLSNGHPSPALLKASRAMREAQLDYLTAYAKWEGARPRAAGLDAVRKRAAKQDELLSTLVTKVLVGPERELRDSTMRTLARRDSARAQLAAAEQADEEVSKLEKQMNDLEQKLSRLAKQFAEHDLEPDGFILELAAGTRARFPEGQWSRERVDGVDLWLTPMYRMSSASFEAIGVVRYLTRVAEYDDRNLFDVGLRMNRDIGKGSIGAEVTNRRITKGSRLYASNVSPLSTSKNSQRWAAIFSIPLPANLQILGSFGSDFKRTDGKRPVIATLGLNLGVGAIMLAPSSRSSAL